MANDPFVALGPGTIATPEEFDYQKLRVDEDGSLKTALVGPGGDPYTIDNPLPVQLSDGSVSIGTVNAELEVQLTHKDNDPDAGDVHDSVRIGDGTTEVGVTVSNELKINDSVLNSKVNTLGQKASAASTPVVLASDQSALPVTDNGGSITVDGTVAATQSGSWSVNVNNASGGSAVNVQDGGNSITVDGTVAISGTVAVTQSTSPWVTTNTNAAGASAVNIQDGGNSITVDGTVAATQSGTWNINNVSGIVSLPTGAATEATLATRLADATFTARINTLGQKTMANSTPVVIASDQTVIPVSDNAGSLTVDQATASSLNAQVVGNVANAAADSGNPVKVAGVFNTTAPTLTNGQRSDLQTDIRGSLYVDIEGRRKTYSASIKNLALALLATDFVTITGAGGTIVRIKHVSLSGESTANAVPDIALLKRSTANSGGTSTTVAAVPHDSNDAAASATVRAYTANPTTGTLVGGIRAVDLLFSGSSTNAPQLVEWEWDATTKNPRLNSASEVLALNFDGVTVAGASVNVNITWTEE